MDDQVKAAFTSATETVKNTLTLSSAVLTVSVAFVKDINKDPTNLQVWVLEASWVFLFLAIVAGMVALMAITGTLAKSHSLTGDSLYSVNIQRPMAAALALFLLGLALTATYGMQSV